MPLIAPKKGLKATVYKVFITDAKGEYAGEYTVDESCVIEFAEFQAAAKTGLPDGQTVFLNEWRATAVRGERMGLVVISKGQLGPEEVGWARAALVSAEAHLGPPREPSEASGEDSESETAAAGQPAEPTESREDALERREKAVAEAEKRMQASWDTYRREFEAEIASLKARLGEAERVKVSVVKDLEAERERLTREHKSPQPDPKLEQMRKQLEADRKYLQNYALDVLAREEKARDFELAAADATAKLAEVTQERDTLAAELADLKVRASQLTPEVAAQRRELEMRVKVLEDKSSELIAREEKLREREARLRELTKQISA